MKFRCKIQQTQKVGRKYKASWDRDREISRPQSFFLSMQATLTADEHRIPTKGLQNRRSARLRMSTVRTAASVRTISLLTPSTPIAALVPLAVTVPPSGSVSADSAENHWKVLAGQVAGSRKLGGECADALRWTEITAHGQTYCVALVADGAGSAQFGGQGARAAVDEALRATCKALRKSEMVAKPALHGERIVAAAVKRLKAEASHLAADLRQLATTLSVVVAAPTWTWLLHIGDGAIVVSPSCAAATEWHALAWPVTGEYANSTYFLTDDSVRWSAQVTGSATAIVLMSDGLVPLALDLVNRLPFGPFFDGIARELAACEVQALHPHFMAMLRSPRVTDRTDDDVSLIFALRTPAPRPASSAGVQAVGAAHAGP